MNNTQTRFPLPPLFREREKLMKLIIECARNYSNGRVREGRYDFIKFKEAEKTIRSIIDRGTLRKIFFNEINFDFIIRY